MRARMLRKLTQQSKSGIGDFDPPDLVYTASKQTTTRTNGIRAYSANPQKYRPIRRVASR